MSRIDVLEKKMFDVMPVSPTLPIEGPRIARARIQAAAIAGDASMSPILGEEQQVAEGIKQLNEGAHLVRIDNVGPPPIPNPPNPDPNHHAPIAADDWSAETSPFWLFSAETTSAPGAAGVFLDQWGRMIQIPRIPIETDAAYAKRIIAESILPSNTNKGMATLIDGMLGTTGTNVLDSATGQGITNIRLNDGNRLNDGLRLETTEVWCCFTVFITVDLPHAGFVHTDIANLVNRHKAAGTRLLYIITPTQTWME